MKKLNVTTILKDFSGEDLEKEEGEKKEKVTLKHILLRFIELAHLMGLSPSEQQSLYFAGLAIGTGGENCILEEDQYSVLKKIVDLNKVNPGKPTESDMYNVLYSQQTKFLVDDAETFKKEKS